MRAILVFALLAASIGVLLYSENVVVCLMLVGLALTLTYTAYRN